MATPTKWALDGSHSEVEFKVKHMMISTVSGKFTKFDASAETADSPDEDPAFFMTAKVTFTADVDSLTTGSDQRDGHLKSPDFFDAAQFPQIKFEVKKSAKNPD